MALRYLASRFRIPDLQRARGSGMSPTAGSRRLTSQSGQRPEVDVEELIRKHPKTAAKTLLEEEIAMLRAKLRAGSEAMEELKRLKRYEKYEKLWLGTCAATGVVLGLLAAAADIRRQREEFMRNFP